MTRLICSLFLGAMLSALPLRAQIDSMCIDVGSMYNYAGLPQNGGLYMTADGEVRTLVLFIQFLGDNTHANGTHWNPNQRPDYFDSYIDSTTSQASVNGSFSDYYRELSFDRLKIFGKPYFAVTPHTESYYRDSVGGSPDDAYGRATKDVLQTLDGQINYALYDNWTFNHSGYNHSQTPDGVVDLIIVIYRNSVYPSGDKAQGIATLGLAEGPITLDGKTIKFGFPSSGITNSGGFWDMWLPSTKHELGHVLLGSGHPSGFLWGIMPGPHSAANAYERHRLGWITYVDITQNTTATLPDFFTTGVAYRIAVPGTTDDAFFIENHQKLSYYDDPNYTRQGKGLFIYQVKGTGNHPAYDLEIAEGKFNWSVPYWIDNPWGPSPDSLPVFLQGLQNKNGFDGREKPTLPHPMSNGATTCEIFFIDSAGTPLHVDRFLGGPLDAYGMDYNQVFSPWSNPDSRIWNNTTATNIAVEIQSKSIGQNGEDIFNVKFWLTNPQDAAPSKPYLAYVGKNTPSSNLIRISWYRNTEPDVNGYEVWRGISSAPNTLPTSWLLRYTVTDTFVVEEDFVIGNGNYGYAHYKIKAKDTQNKKSVYSNSRAVAKGFELMKSAMGGELPSRFDLAQNYPNPFNPSTTIRYSVPFESRINIAVYNVLGQQIRVLVDESKPTGYFETVWDGRDHFGNQVSSGIYLYQLSAGAFVKTNKMILVK